MKGKLPIIITLCIMSVCFSACRDHIIYHSYRPISDIGWQKDDTLCFNLPTTHKPMSTGLQVGIRHTAAYPYSDIWLEISSTIEQHITSDTLHILLATEKGEWKGNGTNGLIQYLHPQPITLDMPDSVKNAVIRITHLMSDSTLTGINDVGIQVSLNPYGKHQSEEK